MSLRVPVAGPVPGHLAPAQGAQDESGLERGHDRLPSLVLATAILPAAIAGLVQGVTGQHPVANWFDRVEGDLRPFMANLLYFKGVLAALRGPAR